MVGRDLALLQVHSSLRTSREPIDLGLAICSSDSQDMKLFVNKLVGDCWTIVVRRSTLKVLIYAKLYSESLNPNPLLIRWRCPGDYLELRGLRGA